MSKYQSPYVYIITQAQMDTLLAGLTVYDEGSGEYLSLDNHGIYIISDDTTVADLNVRVNNIIESVTDLNNKIVILQNANYITTSTFSKVSDLVTAITTALNSGHEILDITMETTADIVNEGYFFREYKTTTGIGATASGDGEMVIVAAQAKIKFTYCGTSDTTGYYNDVHSFLGAGTMIYSGNGNRNIPGSLLRLSWSTATSEYSLRGEGSYIEGSGKNNVCKVEGVRRDSEPTTVTWTLRTRPTLSRPS
jgi:hypothetical protein